MSSETPTFPRYVVKRAGWVSRQRNAPQWDVWVQPAPGRMVTHVQSYHTKEEADAAVAADRDKRLNVQADLFSLES